MRINRWANWTEVCRSNNLHSSVIAASIKSKGTLIIRDVFIFTGSNFIEGGTVVVKDGKIAEVGSDKSDKPYPGDTQVISRSGCSLLLGLIDSHIHGLFGSFDSIEQSLRFGVTTVCDMHNEHVHIQKPKKLASEDTSRYCDFKYAGVGGIIEGG